MFVHGARIGYFQGDIRALSDDLNTLKPTVFPVVPRLLNRMYDKVCGHNDDLTGFSDLKQQHASKSLSLHKLAFLTRAV